MNNIIKSQKIIDWYLGKDVGSIIHKFLWVKCYMCKKSYDVDFGVELYNDKFICDGCITDSMVILMNCSKCGGTYIKSEAINCKLCSTNCLIYCNKCLYPKYYL